MTRHFRSLVDLGRDELLALLDRAEELKRQRGSTGHPRPLEGRTVVVLLEKASTRTRLSFEVGIHELGGYPLTIVSRDTQIGRGEPVEDTARMVSRYAHGVVYRTFGQDRVERLAAFSGVPVVNGLSDRLHPCQLLADLMTVREHVAPRLEDVRVAWVGDGNNVAHSWMLAAGMTGLSLTLACPPGFGPDATVRREAEALGHGTIRILDDPDEAVRDAHVVTTDVWASMGQEDESETRRQRFAAYTVGERHMAQAARDAVFLHCLPAHRGEEVAAEVIDGPASRVWDQAENRLHAQKALLELLLG